MNNITMIDAYEMIRAKHRWSIQEMADILGITKQCYSLYKTGKQPIPKWMDLEKMYERTKLMQETAMLYVELTD